MTEEAPYTYVWEETFVEGKKVKVFKLGKYGKEKLENAVDTTTFNSRLDVVFEQLNSIQDELVRTLFVPSVTEKILLSLKEKPNQTQQEIAKQILPADFAKNKLIHHAFWDAWKTLEKNFVITPESHGRGHSRTWKISIQT